MLLLSLSECTFPMPPEALFGRPGPLVLEVGFGDGWFLEHLAREHPGWNVLGAEVSLGSMTRAFKRLRRERLANVRLYQGQAGFLVRNLVLRHALHRVYVNFPDPWPKKRHLDRRLLCVPFFHLLSTRLEANGQVFLTTDHEEYFDFALAEARTSGEFTVETRPPPPATLRTKYARKWRAQDKNIQHAVFTKTAEADASFEPTVEPTSAMHHALLNGALPTINTFEKIVHSFKGGHVIILEALRPVGGETGYLFVTRIEEKDLTQEVLVEARPAPKEHGDIFVGIKSFGQPLTTRGTKEAVRAIVSYLEQHGLELAQRFY